MSPATYVMQSEMAASRADFTPSTNRHVYIGFSVSFNLFECTQSRCEIDSSEWQIALSLRIPCVFQNLPLLQP